MTRRLATLLGDLPVSVERRGDTDVDVTSITLDSRSAEDGSLYCCIVGRRVDGHAYAPTAVQNGAGSLLVERWLDLPVPQVRVASTRTAIGPIAAAFWGHPSDVLSVVGVTGTNGKTTTTHLVASVLGAAGRPIGLIGTLSGAMTTPDAPALQETLARFVTEGCEAVAMEVSSIALDQRRVDGVTFQVGVWTNLTQDHLDYHGDMESYFAAKARLFEPGRCAIAVVNSDDRWGRRLLDGLHIPAVTYTLADAHDIVTGPAGSRFTWRGVTIDLPLAGDHNVHNALAAATACSQLGVPDATIADGMAAAPPVPGRWERVDAGQPFTVVVDYAHTPDGLTQVLSAARAAAGTHRVIVVFGCGGDRDRDKRPLMAQAATRGSDLAIITSDNPRSEDPMAIIDQACTGAVGPVSIEPDRRAAIRQAITEAKPGDVVVIAGKGHEVGQIIGDTVIPFDDRLVAHELLQAS